VDRSPPPLPRRDFILRSAALAASIPLASILAACSRDDASDVSTSVGSPVGSPLPLHDDLLIDGGAPIERGGVLHVYEWRDYLDHGVVRRFVERYAVHDVDVRIESFESMPEAIARLQEPGSTFDVFFPVIGALPALVASRLLRPLAHDALPHLSNLWPFFTDVDGPFYDVGQRYSVPYTVYATGIGWRTDLVSPDRAPDRLENPYDTYWDPAHTAEVGLVDDHREVISMALLRRGHDPNDAAPDAVDAAVEDLIEMAGLVDLEVSVDGPYEELQTGEYAIQQAWSGDVLAAKRFGPGTDRTLASTAFVWPAGGVVGCDLTAVCAGGRNPRLAHAFLDFLLEEQVALDNFAWNGYQPPVVSAVPSAFADPPFPWSDVVPEHLLGAILAPNDLDAGRFLRPLSAADEAVWQSGWRRFLQTLGS
jgi:spermidine/putrescine transport system substrate-binding protein